MDSKESWGFATLNWEKREKEAFLLPIHPKIPPFSHKKTGASLNFLMSASPFC
jgi:hypothetical protein